MPAVPSATTERAPPDLVAGFFARLEPNGDKGDWTVEENKAQYRTLRKKAPGLMEELWRPEKSREVMVRTPGGILTRKHEIRADGPLLKAYLSVFAAKFGMAVYREHTGTPLPLTGAVECVWYLNSGLNQYTADSYLQMMPGHATLSQGAWHVAGQFGYRFNTDTREIVVALAQFHFGLHLFVFATAQPDLYGLPHEPLKDSYFIRPGELVNRMPQPIRPKLWNIPRLGDAS